MPKKKNNPLASETISKKADIAIRSSAAEYLTFVAATGENSASVEMRYEDENIWLTQKMMAVLYDVEVPTVNYHLKNIFQEHELEENSTIRKYLIVQTEGNRQVSRDVDHYNLQAIIAVGFKVNNVLNFHMSEGQPVLARKLRRRVRSEALHLSGLVFCAGSGGNVFSQAPACPSDMRKLT